MRYVLTFLLCLAASLAGIAREASANEFNATAAGCAPGTEALAANGYDITSGHANHISSYTSYITLYCPVTTNISSPSHVYLLYSSTENNASTYVKASFVKMHKTTGATTVISTANSQNGTNNGTVQWVETTFSDTYNASTYTYYVQVDILRRNTSQSAVFYSVTVW